MRRIAFIAVIMGAAACAPPEAPMDLDDLSGYLFREWPDSDPSTMEAGVSSLYDFLEPLASKNELNGNTNDRSWTLSTLESPDITDIAWPKGENPSNMLAAAVAWRSAYPISDHVLLQLQTNQAPAEPTATHYIRTFLGTSDPSCFTNQACLVLNTSNAVTRANPLGSVSMTLYKSFRWVKLAGAGGTGWAIVARSWLEQSASGSGGSVLQSGAVDVWLSVANDETWRYQATYSQSTPSLPSDIVLAILVSGVDDNLQGDDSAIKKLIDP